MSPERTTLKAVAFFGGGTGGHLFPGVAVAERAQERFPGCRVLFLRSGTAVEDQVFSACGFPTRSLGLRKPSGSAAAWLRYTAQALRVIAQVRHLLRGGFDAAFGLGGYAAFPGVIAARRERVPVVLLEQNLVPGRVTRLLAPLASAVSCPHAAAAGLLRGRAVVTGNPVRRQVLEAAEARRRRRPGQKPTLLVVGGSQGASGINRAVQRALPRLREFRERIRWIHLAGLADKESVAAGYRQGGWEALVREWAPDLPRLMAESDLVIGRAGGTTLAELAVVGVPAVLVPYPYHGDRHQLRNALAFVESGGARLLRETELGAETLRAVFDEILFSPSRLQAMEAGVKRLARPDAADAVIDLFLELKATCRRASVFSS